MSQIYETINKYNRDNGIMPYRYIGSDQNDNPRYYGSSKDLNRDIKKLGEHNFEKKVLVEFIEIDNKELRKKEATILKQNNVKNSDEFYNKSELYAPGGGVKGMKHTKTKVVTEAWRESRKGWVPSNETRLLWSNQRKGRKATEDTKQTMSKQRTGKLNPNALLWQVTDPTGKTHSVVGLRKWCTDNGYNYNRVYHQKDGFILVKNGNGKGGPGYVK